jgi:hypothetical protein
MIFLLFLTIAQATRVNGVIRQLAMTASGAVKMSFTTALERICRWLEIKKKSQCGWIEIAAGECPRAAECGRGIAGGTAGRA